jgi:sialate O-acetylesterase
MLTTLLFASLIGLQAPITLSPLVSDGCVLQRETENKIWGTAEPGDILSYSLVGPGPSAYGKVRVGADGKFIFSLPKHPAGGPYDLVLNGRGHKEAHGILFGDVWLCSGQSNMEYYLRYAAEGSEMAKADDPLLRIYHVEEHSSNLPLDEVASGSWAGASPDSLKEFSAVGYFFGRDIRESIHVPVGLIEVSWGGTRIESWTSKETNDKLGVPYDVFLSIDERGKLDPILGERLRRWHAGGDPKEQPYKDPGRLASTAGWEKGEGNWPLINVPGDWTQSGSEELKWVDGGVWIRREIDIPASMVGKDLTLHMGKIDDGDATWFNGEKVGGIDSTVDQCWTVFRSYPVPGRLVHEGKNIIVSRIWDLEGGGGVLSAPETMYLEGPDGAKLPIAGKWGYRSESLHPEPINYVAMPDCVIYNGMIFPIRHVAAKGVLWYQGESNADTVAQAEFYKKQLPSMMADWRALLGEPELPFFVVQIAPYIADGDRGLAWAKLREAESLTRDGDRNVGLAVITDVGDHTDIHPTHKLPVAQRLALLARKMTYHQRIQAESPRFLSQSLDGAAIRIKFQQVGKGLIVKAGKFSSAEVTADHLLGFQIAGADGNYVDAMAEITGKDTVRVWSPQVATPKTVRFGFMNYPVSNLFNSAGLPAEPFRTDSQ